MADLIIIFSHHHLLFLFVGFCVALSISMEYFRHFAASFCRCVVALCIIKNMHTQLYHTNTTVLLCAASACVYVWVCSMRGICIELCLACCGFGMLDAIFPLPLFRFSSFFFFTLLLACTRTHNNARDTPTSNSISFNSYVCVRARVCIVYIYIYVVPHTSTTVRRPDGAVFCSFPCNDSCACMSSSTKDTCKSRTLWDFQDY